MQVNHIVGIFQRVITWRNWITNSLKVIPKTQGIPCGNIQCDSWRLDVYLFGVWLVAHAVIVMFFLSLQCYKVFFFSKWGKENDLSLPNATCTWVLIGFQKIMFMFFLLLLFNKNYLVHPTYFPWSDNLWNYFYGFIVMFCSFMCFWF